MDIFLKLLFVFKLIRSFHLQIKFVKRSDNLSKFTLTVCCKENVLKQASKS